MEWSLFKWGLGSRKRDEKDNENVRESVSDVLEQDGVGGAGASRLRAICARSRSASVASLLTLLRTQTAADAEQRGAARKGLHLHALNDDK
jgi:hypothetical protein